MTESFADRLGRVQARIRAACERAGRAAGDVHILPISKKHGPDAVKAAASCGLAVFGENRVQEAKQKIGLCPSHLVWHMVGHLQTNKVRDAVRLFDVVHSVDSVKILRALDVACGQAGRTVRVLVEVNVSGEASKYGARPEDVPALLDASCTCMNIELSGLMTMPPFAEDTEQVRPYFAQLRALRDRWRVETGIALEELSMGMSSDFEVAVEEGATWVRLGTVLFGSRTGKPVDGRRV